ncbi:MAG: TolC family protein [Flavobacteriaceae bacterium]|nr:TolC family protein [Flavobacteriaceae bacterium]
MTNSTMTINMNKFVIVFVILFVGISVAAQNKKWTLQECVTYAIENNISVKQSELEIENANISKSDALGNYLPTLNASAGNSWNTGLTQDVTTGVLRSITARNSSYSVTAGVTVFSGLRNHREMQRAKMLQLSSLYNLSKMKDDIALFVANGYLQVLLSKANLEVAREQNNVTIEQISRTQELVDAGVLPKGDLLEIQAVDAREKQSIIQSENSVTISLISLAQLLLIKDYENFDIADEDFNLILSDVSNKSVEEIINSAKENRYEVKIAEQNLEIAQKDLEISKSIYWPTINAFFNYNTRETDIARVSQFIDPDNPIITTQIGYVGSTGEAVLAEIPNTSLREKPADPFFDQLSNNDGISYGLRLNVPVFNGFSTRNNVKRNKVNLKRNEFQLEQAKLDLESNVYQAFVDANGAQKTYEAASLSLKSQELAYAYAKDRFDVGLTNSFDFSQSKLRYNQALIEANRAKFDYIFKIKVLELFFGIPATELKF